MGHQQWAARCDVFRTAQVSFSDQNTGYDRMSAPAQLSPRKVASLEQPVTSITMTDFGMACLLKSYDVILFYSNRHSKVK